MLHKRKNSSSTKVITKTSISSNSNEIGIMSELKRLQNQIEKKEMNEIEDRIVQLQK
jgi:hypothetical protein